MDQLLPDDFGGDGEPSPDEQRIARLTGLGTSLAKKRSEAIQAREASGIEAQWREDEEFYHGVDDANRNEHSNAWRTKPPGQYQVTVQSQTRSTVFPNITSPYVDAASARIADMLLPNDDRNWKLQPTPIPGLVEMAGEPEAQEMVANADQAQQQPPQPQQQLQPPQLSPMAKAAQQLLSEAQSKADKAQTRIEDWHIQGQWHAEVRKVIEDAARCGAGVLKGPYPVKRKRMAVVKVSMLKKFIGAVKSFFGMGEQQQAVVIKEEIEPTSRRIDFWNFYPDPACGEDIHSGSHVFERDYLTPRQLMDLKGTPGYIGSEIDACIEEGPIKAVAPNKDQPDRQREGEAEKRRYEIWYYHGTVDKDDLSAAGCECGDEDVPQIPAMLTMVNDRVIRASMNPLDTGDFPYDVFPWKRMSGLPWGAGVARQGRTAQRIVTGAVRNMMDNAGLSAGGMVVLKQGKVTPVDGNWSLAARKVWLVAEDGDDNVKDAFTFIEVPSAQVELNNIMQMGMKMMEDSTGLPMLLQGQLGKAPDTVGGMTMLNNNASAVLRRLARTFDDCVTEPHIRRYYTWLLQYGEDEEKGDFTIDARGSTALVERDLQNQMIERMLQASLNPAFGIDPKKTMEQWIKSLKFTASEFQFDDDQWQKVVASMSGGANNWRMAVAQLEVQGRERLEQLKQQFEAQENDKDRQLKIAVEMIDARLQTAELSALERENLNKIRASLASDAMKLTTQKELSAASMAVDVHKHHAPGPKQVMPAPTEPAGRAQPGKAYIQ